MLKMTIGPYEHVHTKEVLFGTLFL